MGAVDSWHFATAYPDNNTQYMTNTDDYNYSIENPTISLIGANWNRDPKLWSSEKTMYDPCPAGWRVPDQNAWSGIPSWDYGYWGNGGSLSKIGSPYSEPEAFYYPGGWIGGYKDINEFNSSSICHTVTHANEDYTITMRIYDSFSNSDSRFKDNQIPVRCMKDAGEAEGDNEDIGKNEGDYEW